MSICNCWISQWLCLSNGNNFCRNIMVEYVYYRWSEISSFSSLLKSFKTYYIANFTYSENELQDKFVLLGTNLYLGICLDSSLTVSYMRTFFCCHWATEWSPVWDHIEVDYQLWSLQPNSGTCHFSNSSNPLGEFEKWLLPLNKYRGVYTDILPAFL